MEFTTKPIKKSMLKVIGGAILRVLYGLGTLLQLEIGYIGMLQVGLLISFLGYMWLPEPFE